MTTKKSVQGQILSMQMQLINNHLQNNMSSANQSLHLNMMNADPKGIPTPMSITSNQVNANNRRYFSAKSAAETFNSFNHSNGANADHTQNNEGGMFNN